MELNKISLEQWQDIENLIQLVETCGLTQEVSFQIIGRIPHVSKGYGDDTDLYKDCEKLVSIVKDREPKEIEVLDLLKRINGEYKSFLKNLADSDGYKVCKSDNLSTRYYRYRNICKSTPRIPILLFNEADAILGVRMEGVAKAADKMENSIQNIILQEMEKFEGIMIATTNLTCNLDKAFDRRFLYKVSFERPGVEARMAIWLAMMKGLKRKDAKQLATKFDLSGGEIENVVRRHTVQYILKGRKAADLKALEESCRAERLTATRNPRIGF